LYQQKQNNMKKFENEVGVVVINNEYTLRSWVDLYNKGKFDWIHPTILRDMGGYDWWSADSTFQRIILKELAKKVVAIATSEKIDVDNTYVFFKQNCPCTGPLYCDFRICDIQSGDVLYCLSNVKKGCYGRDFGGWELWDFVRENGSKVTNNETLMGTWRDIKKYFAI